MGSASHYLLAIDVGNSRSKFGLFQRSDSALAQQSLPECLLAFAFDLGEAIPWDKLREATADLGVERVASVIAGVNPAGMQAIVESWPAIDWPPPDVITDVRRLPLNVRVEAPEKVGVDRLLNAVAANAVRPADRSAIIVSSGTATTVDCVSASGAFEGGAILPGFDLSAKSLHQYTALLPLVKTEELAGCPPHPLGRNTRDAIRSGLYWGHVGAVKELIARLAEQSMPGRHGDRKSPMLLLTGGAAALLADRLDPPVRWEPHLALQGLALATFANRN